MKESWPASRTESIVSNIGVYRVVCLEKYRTLDSLRSLGMTERGLEMPRSLACACVTNHFRDDRVDR